jgi:integrase
MGQRLTNRIVNELPAPEAGNRITYDAPNAKGKDWTPGFGVRVTAGGSRAFIFGYRTKTGIDRRLTIGSPPAWSVEAGRKEAESLKYRVDQGEDPLAAIRASRDAPTVADLCERFLEEHVSKKRPSTQRDYAAIVEEIKTALGSKKVATVEYEHVDRLHRDITKRAPYKANRTLAVLSKMFSLAMRWKMRTDNPARGVERNQEQKRKRYLSADELARLVKALDEHSNQQAADVFRFLLLTGARSGEALAATWDQFDEAGIWTKPGATTKQKTDHVVPLSPPARQLLARIRHKQDEAEKFVFPSDSASGHLTTVKKSWREVCKAAGISNLRIHDLRHSYASTVISAGWSLPVVGALLGHTQPNTTARYAHLVDDVLHKATNTAGAILSGRKKAPVLPMRSGAGRILRRGRR